jgi:uncharacterized protein (TIGR02996 family)
MSRHPQEEALHQSIVASPGDDAMWLILADWLEEYDDPHRVELLRLHRKLLATCCEPDRHPERAAWQSRIVELLTAGVRPSVPRQTVTLAKGVEMAFHFIPPGSFLMGSPEMGRSGAEAQHQVMLTRGFWMALTPVTHAQWQAMMGSNPSYSRYKGNLRPVEEVSWYDCEIFCRRLGEKVGRIFRLPTEAEWEYACRAGTTTPFFFGEILSPEQANYDGSHPHGAGKKGVYRARTIAVASFPCNAWGLFDMHGNVWEWCKDRLARYGASPVRDPQGPKGGGGRVIRGGAWRIPADQCRSASRSDHLPGFRSNVCGCRVVLCPG